MNHIRFTIWLILILLLTACLAPPPKQTQNICLIFKNRPKWFWAAEQTEKKWGIPVAVQMAIVYQESHFVADAKTPRHYMLGVVPWFRKSTAYGYSQALNNTWKVYERNTGRFNASRDNFSDALDFIGWYADQATQRTGIAKNDSYHLYLAYHEGIGGFMRKTYLKKTWLLNVSRKVANNALIYHDQLMHCRATLQRKPWYRFW